MHPLPLPNQLKRAWHLLTEPGQSQNLTRRFVRGMAGTLGLKICFTGGNFLVTVALSRLLGVTQYGIYALALAWLNLLIVLATFGIEKLLVRHVTVYVYREQWSLLVGILRWANSMVLGISLVLCGAVWWLSWWVYGNSDPTLAWAISLMSLALPLLALSRLRQGALQGLGHTIMSQVPEMAVRPLLMLLLIGIVLGGNLAVRAAIPAVMLYVIAMAVAFGIGFVALLWAIPPQRRAIVPAYQARVWLLSALPLMLISGAYIVNIRTDILMLGSLLGPTAAGMYTVASRGAELVRFISLAVNIPLAPIIARLYAAGDIAELQRQVYRSTAIMTVGALGLVVPMIAFGHWFLRIFGPDFVAAYPALAILCIGQVANAAMGLVVQLMTMSNHEQEAAFAVGLGAAINIGLNIVLIPQLGLVGAAIASTVSALIWNIVLTVRVQTILGISLSHWITD